MLLQGDLRNQFLSLETLVLSCGGVSLASNEADRLLSAALRAAPRAAVLRARATVRTALGDLAKDKGSKIGKP